jgi:hypothetical protein
MSRRVRFVIKTDTSLLRESWDQGGGYILNAATSILRRRPALTITSRRTRRTSILHDAAAVVQVSDGPLLTAAIRVHRIRQIEHMFYIEQVNRREAPGDD